MILEFTIILILFSLQERSTYRLPREMLLCCALLIYYFTVIPVQVTSAGKYLIYTVHK